MAVARRAAGIREYFQRHNLAVPTPRQRYPYDCQKQQPQRRATNVPWKTFPSPLVPSPRSRSRVIVVVIKIPAMDVIDVTVAIIVNTVPVNFCRGSSKC